MAIEIGNINITSYAKAYSSGAYAAATGFLQGGTDICYSFQKSLGAWDVNASWAGALEQGLVGIGSRFQNFYFAGLTCTGTTSYTGGASHTVSGNPFNFSGSPTPGGWISGFTPSSYSWSIGGSYPSYFDFQGSSTIANPTFKWKGTGSLSAGTYTATVSLTIKDGAGNTSPVFTPVCTLTYILG